MNYCVKRDGIIHFIGTSDQCFAWLLKVQCQSVERACAYEGWSIEESEW